MGTHPWPAPRYRGRFSRSASNRSIKEIEAYPGAIMFIDEIHNRDSAPGATSGGAMDASNLLKACALAAGTVRCIGSHHL